MQWDAVYLNEKRKIGYKKYSQKQQVRESWKQDMVKPKFSINGRMEGLHVIGNAALKYLVGNRSIKVEETITQAMVLRLWLMTG
jgi:hypothetical protein